MADDWDDGQGEPRAGRARTAPLPAALDIPWTAQGARAPAHSGYAERSPGRTAYRTAACRAEAGMGAGVEGAPAEAAAAAYVALRPAAAPGSQGWEEEGGAAGRWSGRGLIWRTGGGTGRAPQGRRRGGVRGRPAIGLRAPRRPSAQTPQAWPQSWQASSGKGRHSSGGGGGGHLPACTARTCRHRPGAWHVDRSAGRVRRAQAAGRSVLPAPDSRRHGIHAAAIPFHFHPAAPVMPRAACGASMPLRSHYASAPGALGPAACRRTAAAQSGARAGGRAEGGKGGKGAN